MKKTLIALATLAVAGTAFAQSSATISGSINVGVMNTGAAGDSAQAVSLGNAANAINLNTVEDLGGGLRGGFSGQIRYNAATGDMNSNSGGVTAGTTNAALFHAANAYISGGFGTVRAGKVAETQTCAFDPWGCTGGAALQGGVGVSGLTGAGTQAQSVSYVTPSFNGFSAGYQTTLSTRVNERQVFNINYSKGPLTASFINIEGGASTGNLTGATAAARAPGSDTATSNRAIGASYNFGVARLSVVNSVGKAVGGAKSADITSIGATVPMGAYTILAGYNKAKSLGTVTAANDTKLAVGVNYALSKRTTLGADLFKAEGLAAVAGTGTAGTGFVVRVGHTF